MELELEETSNCLYSNKLDLDVDLDVDVDVDVDSKLEILDLTNPYLPTYDLGVGISADVGRVEGVQTAISTN